MFVAAPAVLGLLLAVGSHLDEGLSALDALDYDRATIELRLARQQLNLTHADLLRLLEGQGRLDAILGHHDLAMAEFKELLNLDPDHPASANWAPKIRTPFFEAKSWQVEHPPLALTGAAAPAASGMLGLELAADPLALTKTVRVHLVGVAAPIDTPVAGAGPVQVTLPSATPVSYWAEALDSGGASLVLLGSEAHPLRGGGPAASDVPVAAVNFEADEGTPAMRYAGFAVGGAGVAALVVGAVLGAKVQSDQSEFTNASRNAQGQITSLTRAQAIALNTEAHNDAVIADVLFVAGGVAMATGVGLWIGGTFVGAAPEPKGAAVALAGTLP